MIRRFIIIIIFDYYSFFRVRHHLFSGNGAPDGPLSKRIAPRLCRCCIRLGPSVRVSGRFRFGTLERKMNNMQWSHYQKCMGKRRNGHSAVVAIHCQFARRLSRSSQRVTTDDYSFSLNLSSFVMMTSCTITRAQRPLQPIGCCPLCVRATGSPWPL